MAATLNPPFVGFDETVHERRLERTGDAKVRAELPAQIRQLRRRRLQQRDVDGRALHREIDLAGSRRAAGPLRNRDGADGRQHRRDGLLEADVHIDRAPRVIRLARKGVEVDALDRSTGDRKVGLHERIGAGAANLGGRIQDARDRSVAQHQLVDVLHLHVVEPHVEIVGTVRGLGTHRHRAGRCQALIAPQQHEIVEGHRVVRIARCRLLALRHRPLRLSDDEVERAQMQLIVFRMKDDVAAEAERTSFFFEFPLELELLVIVGSPRRHAWKVVAGDGHERRAGIGLDLRAIDVEVGQLHGVQTLERERVESGAILQAIAAQRSSNRQVRRRPRGLADDLRGPRKRLIESLRERLDVGHRDVERELRFATLAKRKRAGGARGHVASRQDELFDVGDLVGERSIDMARFDRHAGDGRRHQRRGAVHFLEFGRSGFGDRHHNGHVGRSIERRISQFLTRGEQCARQFLERPREVRADLPVLHLKIDVGAGKTRAGQRRAGK